MGITKINSNGKKSPTWLLMVIVAVSSLLIGGITTTFTRELSIKEDISNFKIKVAMDYFTKEDAKQMKKDIIGAIGKVEDNLIIQMKLYNRATE